MANLKITEFCKIHKGTETLLDYDVFESDKWADATLCVASQLIHTEEADPEDIVKTFGAWLSQDGTKDVTVMLDNAKTSWTFVYTV